MISLRRLAEAEAQAELRGLRAELERARHDEAQARRALAEALAAEQALQAREAELLGGPPGPPSRLTGRDAETDRPAVLAGQLGALRQGRGQRRHDRQAAEARHRAAAEHTEHALSRIEQGEAQLRLAVARREAAELHAAEQARSARRTRDRQQRAREEEARDRVLTQRTLAASRPSLSSLKRGDDRDPGGQAR
ncbi:MAG: hypothetical protein U1A78_04425 [Polyangia bacterium]